MGWFGGGLELTWQVNVIKMLLNFFFNYQYYHKKYILGVKKVVWDGLDVVWGGLEVVWGVSTDQLRRTRRTTTVVNQARLW